MNNLWLFCSFTLLQPSLGFSHLPVTDEDVRTGDPGETIRRASMIPSQLKDSIASHRLSLAPPAAPVHSHAPPQRAPQVSKAREVRSTRSPLAPKRPAGQVQDLDTPEVRALACLCSLTLNFKRHFNLEILKTLLFFFPLQAKKMVSCFPRTPKGRNLRSTSSQNIAPSPVCLFLSRVCVYIYNTFLILLWYNKFFLLSYLRLIGGSRWRL